ncbi:MAG TPA: AzlD domain-containing protein [Chroococcidiopsis sp.]
MNLWWMIFLAGIGTYLMRSAGVWIDQRWQNAKWLSHLPFAVIFVMAVSSLIQFIAPPTETLMQPIGAIAASLSVIVASLRQLPLVACIAIGCLVYGAIASL